MYFTKYGKKATEVINSLLDKYTDEGIKSIEDLKVLTVAPFYQLGTPMEIIKHFGDKKH